VLLMEIMPSLLAKRNFEPLNTLLQLEPGYRDSPEPNDNMAIVFVKVCSWPACLSDLCCKAECVYQGAILALALVKICACQDLSCKAKQACACVDE